MRRETLTIMLHQFFSICINVLAKKYQLSNLNPIGEILFLTNFDRKFYVYLFVYLFIVTGSYTKTVKYFFIKNSNTIILTAIFCDSFHSKDLISKDEILFL